MGVYISIHVPLAGNDPFPDHACLSRSISIHVPLAGNDDGVVRTVISLAISIHVPLAGNDQCRTHRRLFRSEHFNPRPPRGERQQSCLQSKQDFCEKLTKLLAYVSFHISHRIFPELFFPKTRCEGSGKSMITSGSHFYINNTSSAA